MHLSFHRTTLTSVVLLLLAIGSFTHWALQGRTHIYPDAPAGKFACLSYTPPRDASGHGIPGNIHALIDRDLQQLSKRTHCVRTYSVLNGLDYVPVAARKLGMRVVLGVWIGVNKQTNEREITQAIKVANANRDVIDAIIVGNEVLLRREQTAEALAPMLLRVRAATQLPVTYADVWAFWLKPKNLKLAEAADFVTIHILPYWEDEPVSVDTAMAHVEDIFKAVQTTFPGKHIYVGEVGWPSVGRQREASQPTLLAQARFTREFIALANQLKLSYNFIEAYDQPWKKGLEGTVGGYWGLYDAVGHEKFPLTGPVIADPHWWRGPLTGGIAALLLLAAGLAISKTRTTSHLLQLTLAGFTLGCLGMLQWDYLWYSNRGWLEWLTMSSWTLLCLAVSLVSLFSLSHRWPRTWNVLLVLLLISVAYINLSLVFDARYRDFPTAFLLLPAVLLSLNGTHAARIALGSEGLLLGSWLVLSSLLIGCLEGFINGSAWLWCATTALLGWRVLFDHRRSTSAVSAHQ